MTRAKLILQQRLAFLCIWIVHDLIVRIWSFCISVFTQLLANWCKLWQNVDSYFLKNILKHDKFWQILTNFDKFANDCQPCGQLSRKPRGYLAEVRDARLVGALIGPVPAAWGALPGGAWLNDFLLKRMLSFLSFFCFFATSRRARARPKKIPREATR